MSFLGFKCCPICIQVPNSNFVITAAADDGAPNRDDNKLIHVSSKFHFDSIDLLGVSWPWVWSLSCANPLHVTGMANSGVVDTAVYWRCLYVSVNRVRIGSGNGLKPIWYQANTWTCADLFFIRPLVINSSHVLAFGLCYLHPTQHKAHRILSKYNLI